MNVADWEPLVLALDAWQAEGRIARFWLRDDDAVEATPALDRLLELGKRHTVPMALAVIPAHAVDTLPDALNAYSDIEVALHGWSHENHAAPDQKKQELGSHRPADIVLPELAMGFSRLQTLCRSNFVPVLVPPWNRIDKALLPHLGAIGLRALSVFGPERMGPLPSINTHADIMDWHGTRGCRPVTDIVADVVKRLNEMRETGASMGLLTHHLVHDAAAWDFIDGFLGVTSRHPACRWVRLSALLTDAGAIKPSS